MGKSGNRKSRYESRIGHDLDDEDEGTSARTRPLSFDEIMHKRKSKKMSEGTRDEIEEARDIGKRDSVAFSSIHPDHDKDDNYNDIVPHHNKEITDDVRKSSCGNKEEKMYRIEDSHARSKNRGNHESESKLKSTGVKDASHRTETTGRYILRSKIEERLADHAGGDYEEKNSRDLVAENRHMNRGRGNFGKDDKRKDRNGYDDPKDRDGNVHRSRGTSEREYKRKDQNGDDGPIDQGRQVGRSRGTSEREDKWKNRKTDDDPKAQDRYVDTSKRTSEREDKRRDQNGEDAPKDQGRQVGRIRGTSEREDKWKDRNRDDDSIARDRHVDTGRGTYEREDKRKDKSREYAPKALDRQVGIIRGREDKRQDRNGDDGPKVPNRYMKTSRGTFEEVKMVDQHGKNNSKSEARHVNRSKGAFAREDKRRDQNGDVDFQAEGRHTGKVTTTSEREVKRRDRNGDDDKYGEKKIAKKHDSRKRLGSEIVDEKEMIDTSYSRHNEGRLKRRRSRSQEQIRDRDRRSSSCSPEVRKHVSSKRAEHGDLSTESHRDRNRSSGGDVRRHGVSSSGLGGYSPRKRKTEAAVKTPSPTRHSPEKKNAGWDLPPAAADTSPIVSKLSAAQLFPQTKPLSTVEPANVPATSIALKPFSGLSSNYSLAINNASIDSIQLTQATRPMRRLYIDNVPTSASEKDMIDCFNKFLLSSGASHIQGTQPCISCMIHKEKGQAFVEFLTPEAASRALSFDGRSFHGCILKIRRPKDFVEVANGPVSTSKAEPLAVSDIVKDSPHKIFIGGISEALSSEMLMGIASAFGPLKAYCFDVNKDFNERCAFLEYADQSITLKAIAGLNGMKLGGKVLTVAQAMSNVSSVETTSRLPYYGIPEHVEPLLQKPTVVLMINNVLNEENIKLFSEPELEEILEDVRLECARFGSVKSINLVKTTHSATSELHGDLDNLGPSQALQDKEYTQKLETETRVADHDVGSSLLMDPRNKVEGSMAGEGDAEHERNPAYNQHDSVAENHATAVELGTSTNDIEEHSEEDKIVEGARLSQDKSADDLPVLDSPSVVGISNSDVTFHEFHYDDDTDGKKEDGKNIVIDSGVSDLGTVNNASAADRLDLDKANEQLQGADPISEPEFTVGDGMGYDDVDPFEIGCILVEFKRTEASCLAAHCLHGRLFDGRVVSVQYVSWDQYQARFPK